MGEEAAAIDAGFRVEDPLANRGRLHYVEVVAAEHHARDDRYRHLDGPGDRAIRLLADDLPTTPRTSGL
jgi:hypothetical protein